MVDFFSNLLTEREFSKLLKKAFSKILNRKSFPYKIGSYNASAIGYCQRRLWYEYKHGLKDISTDVKKVFRRGVVIHEHIGNLLKDMERDGIISNLELEKRIVYEDPTDGFKIKGYADAVFYHPDTDQKYVVEVKSTKNLQQVVHYGPSTYHNYQISFYLNQLNITHGFLLYVDATTLEVEAFFQRNDMIDYSSLIKRVSVLHWYLINNRIPPPEKDGTFECRFCAYKNRCLADR